MIYSEKVVVITKIFPLFVKMPQSQNRYKFNIIISENKFGAELWNFFKDGCQFTSSEILWSHISIFPNDAVLWSTWLFYHEEIE